MLHAYFVLKKRLRRIQVKNADFLALLTGKFPFLDPNNAATLPTPRPPSTQPLPPDASSTTLGPFLPPPPSLLSPTQAARVGPSGTVGSPLWSSLLWLSTHSLKVHLLRGQALLAPGDKESFVYLVRSGALVELRTSQVEEEEGERVVHCEYPHAVLNQGDDVGLYQVIAQMSDVLQAQQRRERREKARLKAEEEEWERVKLRGGLSKNDKFLRSKKTREREEQHRSILLQPGPPSQLSSRPASSSRPGLVKDDPFAVLRSGGPPVSCRVVAREPSVVYALPRSTVVECLMEHVHACVRMRRWIEERERWREERWMEEERMRGEEEQQRRRGGEAELRRPGRSAGGGSRFRSWQSLYVEEKEREEEGRGRARREEEKKRKMEEAMVAMHKTSQAILEAVGEGHGLGWSGPGRSREEDDALTAKVKREAEVLNHAMNKRTLLNLFHTKAWRDTERTTAAEDSTSLPACIEEPVEGRDIDHSASQQEDAPRVEEEPPRRVSLPPLRLDQLPPPSPPSVSSTPEVAMSEATSALASPAESTSTPALHTSAPSPLSLSEAESPTNSTFVFPITPHSPTTVKFPILVTPPTPPSASEVPSAMELTSTDSTDDLGAAVEGGVPSASVEVSLRLPLLCESVLRGSKVRLCPEGPRLPSVQPPPPPPYVQSLLLSLLGPDPVTGPLRSLAPAPRRPRTAHALLSRRNQARKLRRKPASLPSLSSLPALPQAPRSPVPAIHRLKERLTTVWRAEEKEREERAEAVREEVVRRVKDAIQQRLRVREKERARRAEEEQEKRTKAREEDERKERDSLEAFNFVNFHAIQPPHTPSRRPSTAAPTFLTQPRTLMEGAEEDCKEGEGVAPEEVGQGECDGPLQLRERRRGTLKEKRRHSAVSFATPLGRG